MSEGFTKTMEMIWSYLPNIIGALLVLIVGWLIALLIAALVRGLLRRTSLDQRLAKTVMGPERARRMNIEEAVAKVVFYLILILVFVAFFQALGLTLATQPLNEMLTRVFEYIPRIVGAVLLLLVAWILASLLRMLVVRMTGLSKLEEKFEKTGTEQPARKATIAQTLGNIVYWLVFLLFLPAVLGALQLEGLLEPVRTMVNQFLGFLPNVLGAILIVALGWFGAKLVYRIVANLLAAAGLDRLSERTGLSTVIGQRRLSETVGLILYILILIPVLIAALNALQLEAITAPASNMLNLILGAIPSIFAAALVLVIAYVVARIVAALVSNVLTGLGFDHLPTRMGLTQHPAGEWVTSPSQAVGWILFVAIMLFATIEASDILEFTGIATIVSGLTVFLGRVVYGIVILIIGMFLANLAAAGVRKTSVHRSDLLAVLAKAAILVITIAVALQQVGVGERIVVIAFTLTVGAAAIAAAIAFGIGGRDIASRKLNEWAERYQGEEKKK